MARESRKLTLNFSRRALADLESIWEWNAKQYGFSRADRYFEFLKSATVKLILSPNPGRPVPTSTIYRYAVLKRRSKGYGHIVVFMVEGQTLHVWRYYHTSQDWQTKLTDELPS